MMSHPQPAVGVPAGHKKTDSIKKISNKYETNTQQISNRYCTNIKHVLNICVEQQDDSAEDFGQHRTMVMTLNSGCERD